jgi:Tn3 transposase DDE domain
LGPIPGMRAARLFKIHPATVCRLLARPPNPLLFLWQTRARSGANLASNQFTGLNAITVPGTLRDSLVLLAVVLEQQTELQPTQIMTDTGAYSDVVFGLFRLLGYRFSPRLADIGGTRFWRIDPQADYGELNALARQRVNLDLIAAHWDDVLRLAGSLQLSDIAGNFIPCAILSQSARAAGRQGRRSLISQGYYASEHGVWGDKGAERLGLTKQRC